jgi:hypothetical protein
MNSISKYQFAALLLITDLFSLCCLRGGVSVVTLWGLLAGTAVQFLAAICFAVQGGALKKWAQFFFLVYAVFSGGALFVSLWLTRDAIYIPYEESHGVWGSLMTAGLIALVCLYASSTGIKSVARAAVIAAVLAVLCMSVDLISAVFNAEWRNVSLPEDRDFLSEVLRGFGLSGSLGSMAVWLDSVKGDKSRALTVYFAAKAMAVTAVMLTVLPVVGGIMTLTDFPVITAAQLSQPFEAQRIDSLFLVVFSVLAVFSVTLRVMTGAYLLGELFPRFQRWRSLTVIALTVGAAFVISQRELTAVRACAAIAALLIAPLGAKKSAAIGSG